MQFTLVTVSPHPTNSSKINTHLPVPPNFMSPLFVFNSLGSVCTAYILICVGTIHWSIRPSTFWPKQFFINLTHWRRLPYPVGQYCVIKSLYMYLPCPYHERCFLSWILNKIKCWQNKLIWRVTQDISKRTRIGGICAFRGCTHLGVVICNVVSGIQMQVSHMPKLPCWSGRKYW